MFCREQRPLLPKNLRVPDGIALLSQMWEALFENEKTKFAVAAAAMAAGTYIEPQPPPPMPPMPHTSLPAARPAPVAVAFNPPVPKLVNPQELARNPTTYPEPISSEAVHAQLAARRVEIAAQISSASAHRLAAGAPLGLAREISQAREVPSVPPFAAAAAAPAATLAQGGDPQGAAPPPVTSRHHSAGQQHTMCSAADSNPHLHLHPTTDQPLLNPRPSPLAPRLPLATPRDPRPNPDPAPNPNQGTAAGHHSTRWAARRLARRSTRPGAAMAR